MFSPAAPGWRRTCLRRIGILRRGDEIAVASLAAAVPSGPAVTMTSCSETDEFSGENRAHAIGFPSPYRLQ